MNDTLFGDQLPASIIKSLSIKVKEIGGVNLGQGIPSFPTAPHIIAAAKDALNDPVIGVYPNFWGILELREAIIEKFNREYSNKLRLASPAGRDSSTSLGMTGLKAESNILITVGAMEATAASIFALVNTGERVGIVTPDYCNHLPQVQLARGIPVEISLKENHDWKLDLERLEVEAKTGLKLLIITNPGNPTGVVSTKADLDGLLELSQKYGFWILADETYSFLSYDAPFVSLLDYWEKSERLLVVRSFSKEYAMTGWRVGYVVGKPSVMKAIASVHDALTGCAPKISQRAALAAVTGPQNIVGEYQKILGKRRERVCELLDAIPQLSYVRPRGAYYVFPTYDRSSGSLELSNKILEEAHVAVVPGVAFGAGGEGHIRISFAVDDVVLEEGLARLRKFFSQK